MNPILARLLIYGLLAGLLMACGFLEGYRRGELKLFDYQAKEATATVAIVKKQGKVTDRIITKYVKVVERTADTTMGIKREVVRYVESNPGACLDDAWRRLHDAAATNTVPERPAGVPDPLRAPRADPSGAGDDGFTRTGGGDGQLRPPSSLR